MTNRRGLTLLEVLLATAMLALLAASTTPLMVQARASLEHEDSADVHVDLDTFADTLLDDPAAYGIDDIHVFDHVTIDWPESPDATPIIVKRLNASDETVEFAWLAVQWRDSFVLRRLQEPSEDKMP